MNYSLSTMNRDRTQRKLMQLPMNTSSEFSQQRMMKLIKELKSLSVLCSNSKHHKSLESKRSMLVCFIACLTNIAFCIDILSNTLQRLPNCSVPSSKIIFSIACSKTLLLSLSLRLFDEMVEDKNLV